MANWSEIREIGGVVLLLVGMLLIAVSGVLKWLMQGEVRSDQHRWFLFLNSSVPDDAYTKRGLQLRHWRVGLAIAGVLALLIGVSMR